MRTKIRGIGTILHLTQKREITLKFITRRIHRRRDPIFGHQSGEAVPKSRLSRIGTPASLQPRQGCALAPSL